VGCIPSKALLDSSHHYWDAMQDFEEHGIEVKPKLHLKTMMGRKEKVVEQLRRGVKGLLAAAKIDVLQGEARLHTNKEIVLTPPQGKKPMKLTGEHIVLASGSHPIDLRSCPMDQHYIVDSTGALEFDEVPGRLGIIGAGIIGLELGSVWRRLGASVSLLEALPNFLPAVDKGIAAAAQKIYTQQGLEICLGARVEKAEVSKDEVRVEYTLKDKTMHAVFDKLIVAVGRAPATANLIAENSGVQIDERGFIEVNQHCQTSLANVYAIGDSVRGPMLAHKASEEGVMVAERIAGKQPELDYDLIPGVLYAHPEIAWVGKNRQQLDAEGISYKVGEFPFSAIGRAIAAGQTEGKVVILADATTDRVLGCHIVGAHASELIQQIVLVMEFCGSTEDIALSVFGHPTLSEAVHEAALMLDNRAIHLPAKPAKR
jgi:dihydrolipoamide dehydrogenase